MVSVMMTGEILKEQLNNLVEQTIQEEIMSEKTQFSFKIVKPSLKKSLSHTRQHVLSRETFYQTFRTTASTTLTFLTETFVLMCMFY